MVEEKTCVERKAGLASADQEIQLGVSRQRAGDAHGAVECFRRALQLDPSSCAAYNGLGSVFASLRDWETALIFVRAAVELNPGSAEIHSNLGLLYLKQDRAEQAVEHCRQAALLKPENAVYANALGNALRCAGHFCEAETWIRKAIVLHPGYAEALVNLGFLYFIQGEPAARVEAQYRQAIAAKPDLAEAHVNLSHCMLRRGAFAEGWREHEWRWWWKDFPSPKRDFKEPQWRGEPIAGARLLLHAEQGFGDTIQFLRYVPMAAGRGARMILEVHPELYSLVAGMADGMQVIARGDPLPEFDWHCPLMSLPLAFGTELKSIPAPSRCVLPDGEVPEWFEKKRGGDLRVGLVWAGGAVNVNDRERSLPLAAMAALSRVKDACFYSLQRGSADQEAESGSFQFVGRQPQTGDFVATAAAISQLDLVITVDTSVAHLAGTLGKPVWILLARRSDWRWLTERDESPWYPSARLFRQKVAGEWGAVVADVEKELSRVVAERAGLAAAL